MLLDNSTLFTTAIAGTILASGSTCLAHATSNETPETEKVPVVYIIPMEGQMGTDIHEDNMAKVIEDIREQNPQPDIVVMRLNSADFGTNYHLMQVDQKETGMSKIEEYRGMVSDLQENIPSNIRQVVWVEDSVGWGSLLAVAWENMYMAPEARLWGLRQLFDGAQSWSDDDVREKMEEAWEGIGRGFFELGGHGEFARVLGGAMMDPTKMLSADFKGRSVIWRDDVNGDWKVDDNDEQEARFEGRLAEDTMLSDGIAESIEDLMFLMGYREYETNTSGEELVARYKDQWRRAYKDSLEAWADYQGGGRGNDALKQALSQKINLDKVLRNMKRFSAVERRLQREIGIDITRLELMLDQINDQIRQIKNNGRGNNRGRGGGSGVSGGGGRGR